MMSTAVLARVSGSGNTGGRRFSSVLPTPRHTFPKTSNIPTPSTALFAFTPSRMATIASDSCARVGNRGGLAVTVLEKSGRSAEFSSALA